MAENRVKVVIEGDAAGAITSFGDFLKVLDRTGASVKLSDAALAKLSDRFRDKLSADQAQAALDRTRQQIDRLGMSAGLSQQEIARLTRQLGVVPAQATAATNAVTNLSSGATASAGAFDALIAQLTAAVAAYISLKSIIGLVSEALSTAARYQTMGVVLEQVGQNAGYARTEMDQFVAGVQKAGISMVESRESVVKMAAAQLDLSKAAALARVAQDAAVIANTNSSDAFGRLVQGITTGQTILLHHMGIMVDLEDAYKKYAAQIGVTKGELTEAQKRQAALNAVLDEGAKRAGTYEAAMGTVGKQLQSFKRYVQDVETVLGTAFLDAASSNVDAATESMRQLQEVIKDPATQEVLSSLANGLANVLNILITETPNAVAAIVAGIQDIKNTWAAVPDEVKTLLKYGSAAAVGARMGGIGGAVVAVGLTALDSSDGLRNWRISSMEDHASKMNDALYNEIDPQKVKQLEADLNAQLDLLDRYSQGKLSILQQYAEESKRLSQDSAQSSTQGNGSNTQIDETNRLLAQRNKEQLQYNNLVNQGVSILDKEKSHLPADMQKDDTLKKFQSQQKTIAEGWTAAYQAGDWDTVRKLNDAAAASLGAYNDKLDALDRKANRGAKSAANAAVAAERYGEQASAYLDNVTQSLQSMQDSLSGGMNKEADRVDKWFVQAINQAQKAMVGAKGDTSAYVTALQKLRDAWPKTHDLAVQKDIISALKQQAQLLQDVAQATGDPAVSYEAQQKSAQAWYAEKKQLIETSYQDEAEKADMLAKLQQGYDAKLLAAKADAYKDLAGVSDQYWDAEKERIEQHLAVVKQNATDETAYKMYEAQQWDAYNKELLEKQEQYAGSFQEVLAAKWALTYGTYKSAATQAQEAWEQTAQSIVDTTNNVADGVAGGVGDMVRSFGDGTTSIESLFQNLKSRVISIFASMIEEMLKRWLTDFVGNLDIGSLFGSSSTSASSGGGSGISLSSLTGSGNNSSGSITNSLSSLKTLGNYLGDAAGSSFGDYLTTAVSTGDTLFVGGGNALASIFTDGIDASALGSSALWTSEAAGGLSASTMASTYSAAETAAMSASSLLSSTLGVVGAVGAVAGLVTSLFSSSEKTEKTGSGYKIAINAGTLDMSGVDFYKTTTQSALGGTSTSNFSVDTGMVDPDVAKQVNDALKEAAENLHDFGKVLGITTGDLLAGLTMPEMTITDGQMDSYIRNTSNTMAFQALDNSGLRGAFDAVAERYEVYVDEFNRLADAYQLVGGYTEAYGYDLETLAGITADDIASIRQINTETAEGTSQAILTMASAMGATSDQLAELAANANDGSAALAVTDQQLSKILQADYASQLEDAVGGEDAFETLMQNLVKNVLDSVEAYQEQASYYTDKANESLQELGASGVTIDNFWQRFDAAMHSALSVDDFERWADAAGWVNALNTISDALDSWATTVHQAYQALDVRALKAQGRDYQADLTEALASAEQELTAARAAGYDAAYLARLAEVQALEYAAKIAQHAEDYANGLRDAQKRYATALDDNTALISIQMAENAAELADLAKTYNWSVGSAEETLFQTLQKAQWAELIAQIQESGDAITQATEAMQRDLEARKAMLAGYDAEAEALQKVAGFADELTQAYEDGIDDSLLADLMQVQIDELAKYWSDTLDSMKSDLQDLYKSQSDLMDTLNGSTQTAMQELQALFVRYKAGETDLADQIIESLQSIASAVDSMVNDIHDTIYKIRTGEDYTTDTANVVADNALAYYNEQLAKAASGDTDAMGSIGTYATSYLDAVKSSTADESVYASARDYVTSTLSSLASGASSGTSGLSDIAQTVTDDQIAEAELAIKRAEVAQLKTSYDTLWAQAVAAFQGSKYGSLVAQMATTAVGWSGGVGNLLTSDYWDGGTNSMRAADAILSGSGGMTSAAYVGWYLQNYGAGTGYVDWSGALSQWVTSSQATWPSVAALPSDVMSLYSQAMSAYQQWQTLKSTYGFDAGGVIVSDSAWGDNTLVRANDAERVLTPSQNEAFEELAFGRGGGELVSVLIARMDRLADKVDAFRQQSNQWDRIKARKLSSMDDRQDDWAVNGSLQVGVKGTVTVDKVDSTVTVEAAS